ncbi:MAG: FMN-binding glutamate synthase family protein [Pseudomonadota bacterium]
MSRVEQIINLLAGGFIFLFGSVLLVALVLYVIDRTQKTHTIRRNYPLIGRFRYLFEHLGEYFRQYFFAMDREELPFNRAQRSWVYRAAKNVNNTIAFGSTRDLTPEGTLIFANCAFPILDDEACAPSTIEYGPHCRHPFRTASFFNVSAMSYGSLSAPAIKALSHGANQAGSWLNTGEGGLSDHHMSGGCDIVFQIGTAKYGVRDENGNLSDDKLREVAAHPEVRMFEIKLSQGAKPGKGGILPAEKVTEEIARIRGIPAGKASISPNRHPEIDSPESLLDMVAHVREVSGKPVGFKSVMGDFEWFADLLREIRARGRESAPDFITIDSADGGTGAAPSSLMDYMGLTIQEALPQVVNMIRDADLGDRIRVIASGKLLTPSLVAWALCTGAAAVNCGRGFMFALGCIQSLKCNENTCPTGIATHRKDLLKGLDPMTKAERVAHYATNMIKEVSVIARSCGVAEPRALNRTHARMVVDEYHSVSLEELYAKQGPVVLPPLPLRADHQQIG